MTSLSNARAHRVPALALILSAPFTSVAAQPVMLDPALQVRTYVSGLSSPTTMAFLDRDDLLVLEKASGTVRRVRGGVLDPAPVLDLAVNSNSERGLLGIAIDRRFHRDPTVYLFWTESTTGNDSTEAAETPLLGNRVDRYRWNGSRLVFEANLLRIRAFQADANQPLRGNHDGGVLAIGPDRRLYVFIGDVGRRGLTQNLPFGPFGVGIDDQFGGPLPDNAHLTGVILRVDEDGDGVRSNPFYDLGRMIGGELGANVQRVYSYGHRNSFGMTFDPRSGNLWLQENGDDSFSELNLVERGMDGGWVQVMGPIDRVREYKAIETSAEFFGLQQLRWPPTNIADTPAEARLRLAVIPGGHYSDPEFSWKYEVAPGGIGFVDGSGLGREFEGDLFMGAARPSLLDGHLFRFDLSRDRRQIDVHDFRLEDRVADNLTKFDITESESLLVGRGFGVVTDIECQRNGNLFLVSLSAGAIYEISRTRR